MSEIPDPELTRLAKREKMRRKLLRAVDPERADLEDMADWLACRTLHLDADGRIVVRASRVGPKARRTFAALIDRGLVHLDEGGPEPSYTVDAELLLDL